MDEPETRSYRCLVTLLLEDVTEETARRFFEDGRELEGVELLDGYLASIEEPGRIKPVTS